MAGQASLVPSQTSATSQMLAAPRHGVLAGAALTMHVPLEQVSRSQELAVFGLQMKPSGRSALPGHALLLPVQFSAGSQEPVEARQTVEFDAYPSIGHAAAEPVQYSATSQTPFCARQTVVNG